MVESDREDVKPSEQRGGTTPDETEAREKGSWAGSADQGIVPAELGGSDAPKELLGDDPELGSAVLEERPGHPNQQPTAGSTPTVARALTQRKTAARCCQRAPSPTSRTLRPRSCRNTKSPPANTAADIPSTFTARPTPERGPLK